MQSLIHEIRSSVAKRLRMVAGGRASGRGKMIPDPHGYFPFQAGRGHGGELPTGAGIGDCLAATREAPARGVANRSHAPLVDAIILVHHLPREDMTNLCPYCQSDLGDLEEVQNELSQDKLNGRLDFFSSCCGEVINAFSRVGQYYITSPDDSSSRQQIGAG